MAAGTMPKVGEPITCDEPCSHPDCQYIRRLTELRCVICGERVQAGRRYYLEGEDIVHAVCREEQVALERKASTG